ncbi:immunoglobulin kappa light chain-like isoform X1 [Hippoglossus hippoglossus]|uniref:immunoglobulin kappa light chain-like isoform X1 n=1 Tax=Hippoglossus hippoglossus TaxID=8267 RepID=UPI00148D1E3B|nr:immunoglobulin kappa light chain-like isoform X1 [Hippoglossus hippoglossus]
MMTSPKFVLYLTCFFLGKMVQMHHVVLSHQVSGFISADVGDNLTLQCSYEERDNRMYWYKQTPGQKPRIISKIYRSLKSLSLENEFKDNQRFTVETNDVVSYLNISDLQLSDSATYYCSKREIYVFEFMESITVSVKGSGSNIQALVHHSESIQPGGSVTLSCTVHTGTCDGEHSVYWFKNSEEPQPGLIYTHGDRNDQCERKPDTQTHSCVYNLSMERLNRSHAGTYYCAVSACGHIVFGDGTKLEFDDEVNWLVYFLSGALGFTISLLLAVLLYKINKRRCWRCSESRTQPSSPSTTNAEGNQHADDLHYAALNVNVSSRSRRQRDNTNDQCLYSSVKL